MEGAYDAAHPEATLHDRLTALRVEIEGTAMPEGVYRLYSANENGWFTMTCDSTVELAPRDLRDVSQLVILHPQGGEVYTIESYAMRGMYLTAEMDEDGRLLNNTPLILRPQADDASQKFRYVEEEDTAYFFSRADERSMIAADPSGTAPTLIQGTHATIYPVEVPDPMQTETAAEKKKGVQVVPLSSEDAVMITNEDGTLAWQYDAAGLTVAPTTGAVSQYFRPYAISNVQVAFSPYLWPRVYLGYAEDGLLTMDGKRNIDFTLLQETRKGEVWQAVVCNAEVSDSDPDTPYHYRPITAEDGRLKAGDLVAKGAAIPAWNIIPTELPPSFAETAWLDRDGLLRLSPTIERLDRETLLTFPNAWEPAEDPGWIYVPISVQDGSLVTGAEDTGEYLCFACDPQCTAVRLILQGGEAEREALVRRYQAYFGYPTSVAEKAVFVIPPDHPLCPDPAGRSLTVRPAGEGYLTIYIAL